MESIPAVFVVGSMVNKINVSVQNGQPPSVDSPPRKPTNRMLTRLPPSQPGYLTSWATGISAVAEGLFPSSMGTITGVASGLTNEDEQLAGGIPGSEVS